MCYIYIVNSIWLIVKLNKYGLCVCVCTYVCMSVRVDVCGRMCMCMCTHKDIVYIRVDVYICTCIYCVCAVHHSIGT